MEEWRATPALSVAANGGPLAARISRILGLRHASETRTAGLGASFVSFSAAVVAASLLWGFARPAAAAKLESAIFTPIRQQLEAAAPTPKPPQASKANVVVEADPLPMQEPAAQAQAGAKASYIDEMKSVGFNNLDVDDLVSMKIQGVTADYVREIRAAGFN